jgi:hypothetical protein
MTLMPIAGPLAVAETDRIAALLAEVSGKIATRQKTPPPKPTAPPADIATTQNVRTSVRQMLEEANWRNEAPEPIAPPTEPLSVVPVGPLPAPFGVLTVATLFGLVNWRNRSDDIRPLPFIKPPPAPGSEFTVESVMSTFGWE